jgi:hypothetical protein
MIDKRVADNTHGMALALSGRPDLEDRLASSIEGMLIRNCFASRIMHQVSVRGKDSLAIWEVRVGSKISSLTSLYD